MENDRPFDRYFNLDPAYEMELRFLRNMGILFSRDHDMAARRLDLRDGGCDDPHVERLIQAAALLSARVQRKLDADYPEVVAALTGCLYPHLLAPTPAMGVAQFTLDPAQARTLHIERKRLLVSRPSHGGMRCQFRTCYDVNVWPIQISSASLQLPSTLELSTRARRILVLRLELTHKDASFADLPIPSLRLYLDGPSAFYLYDLLLRSCSQIEVRCATRQYERRRMSLKPVGFGPEEGLVDYSPFTTLAHRLIYEYFALPQKFLFCDIEGMRQAQDLGNTQAIELLFYLDDVPPSSIEMTAESFKLGCTPIVNLFDNKRAEAIYLKPFEYEHHVVPDTRREFYEVHSIRSVVFKPENAEHAEQEVRVQPLYSFGSGNEEASLFYATSVRVADSVPVERSRAVEGIPPSVHRADEGNEVYISIVDRQMQGQPQMNGILLITVSSTNRNLPARIPWGKMGDFQLDGAGAEALLPVGCPLTPRPARRLKPERDLLWRLISHLSLNYLSLSGPLDDHREGRGGSGAVESLRELLRIYNFLDLKDDRNLCIDGILAFSVEPTVAAPATLRGFCRGIKVTLELDDKNFFKDGSAFLFGSVLERFFGLMVSINSFSQLSLRTLQRREIKEWLPRAGLQSLL